MPENRPSARPAIQVIARRAMAGYPLENCSPRHLLLNPGKGGDPMRALGSIPLVLFRLSFVGLAQAKPPLPIPGGGGGGKTLKRLPDNTVEGIIFEYKGTLKSKPKEGEEAPAPLEGKFRIEKTAIFDVSPTFKV